MEKHLNMNDKEIILEAVKQNGYALEYSSELFDARMSMEYPELHL